MTKEIKFRAWLKEQKKLVPVSGLFFNKSGRIKYIECNTRLYFPKEFVLMQKQIHKDTYEKEIYEGDIVSVVYIEEESSKKIKEIVNVDRYDFYISGSPYHLINEYTVLLSAEVIGNIYENPELLKFIGRKMENDNK